MDADTDTQLTNMASKYIKNARIFVSAYRKAQRQFSDLINMRTFYTLLKSIKHENLHKLKVAQRRFERVTLQ